jgi:hypothetical protein
MEKTACRINGEFLEYFILIGPVQKNFFEFLKRNKKNSILS